MCVFDFLVAKNMRLINELLLSHTSNDEQKQSNLNKNKMGSTNSSFSLQSFHTNAKMIFSKLTSAALSSNNNNSNNGNKKSSHDSFGKSSSLNNSNNSYYYRFSNQFFVEERIEQMKKKFSLFAGSPNLYTFNAGRRGGLKPSSTVNIQQQQQNNHHHLHTQNPHHHQHRESLLIDAENSSSFISSSMRTNYERYVSNSMSNTITNANIVFETKIGIIAILQVCSNIYTKKTKINKNFLLGQQQSRNAQIKYRPHYYTYSISIHMYIKSMMLKAIPTKCPPFCFFDFYRI